MSSKYRVTRRVSGAAGAPSTLLSGQIAYNMVDGYFYVGFGDDGSGNATSIKAFAKDDFNVGKLLPAGGTAGQVLSKSSGSDYATSWTTLSPGQTYTQGSGITINGNQISVDFGVAASLASPALSGTPTAPTAASSVNNTQIATTAYVMTAINNLIGGAGSAWDTLSEIQNIITSDEGTLNGLVTTVGGKLQKDQNLSDLTNVSTARSNLGLGSMAVQNASAVAITGGTIDGVVLDGGTF